ncbi:MAG: hypothetical protein ACKPKO_35650, partial [Candidatus Fonsibacter sp.]
MDLHVLDFMYAAELHEDIWEDVPGDSPSDPRAVPNAPNDIGIMPYDGPNWKDLPNEGPDTITVAERRFLSIKLHFSASRTSPIGSVAKYQCGHAVCTDCVDN